MDETTRKPGRPPLTAGQKKKGYTLTFNAQEYEELHRQASAAGFPGQPSAYLIKKLKLNATPKPKHPTP